MKRANDYTRELASGIADLNTRLTRRAEAAATFVVVLFAAIIGVIALVHYLTPCEAGSLCMAAVVRPTRIGLWLRLRMTLRAAYLRTLISACERDIEFHQATQEQAPQLEALARQRKDELQVQLIDCEPCTRQR